MRGAVQTLTHKDQRQQNQYWQCKQIRELCVRHLRTLREANVHPLTAHPGLKWHSEDNRAAAIGAITGHRRAFIQDDFTWINLPKGGTCRADEIAVAISAVAGSTRPARVIMLCEGEQQITTADVRMHKLMSIPTGAITLTSTDTKGTTIQTNTTPLTLLHIENKMAPAVDYNRLRQETKIIQAHITVHQPSWAVPRDYYTNELPSLTTRHPSHQYPALSWYRMEPECEENKPPYRTRVERMIAAIGAGPRNLSQILRSNGIPESMLTTETMDNIREKIRNTAYEAFIRQERWTHADKYGPQGPRPEPSW